MIDYGAVSQERRTGTNGHELYDRPTADIARFSLDWYETKKLQYQCQPRQVKWFIHSFDLIDLSSKFTNPSTFGNIPRKIKNQVGSSLDLDDIIHFNVGIVLYNGIFWEWTIVAAVVS